MEKRQAVIGKPSRFIVHCVKDDDFGSCGESHYLSEDEYEKQMDNPDKPWRCPNCQCYPCGIEVL